MEDPSGPVTPAISLVLPLFNEAEAVERVVAELEASLIARKWPHEIVLVVNGSLDGTGAICTALTARFPACRVVTVPVNIGYGNGVLAGIHAARGTWVGFMAGDGQIDSGDACRVIEAAIAGSHDLVKAARARRTDEPLRRFVSLGYRTTLRLFFDVACRDSHGVPKCLRRESLVSLQLVSRDWFLDDEVMIKARSLGWSVLEVPVGWRPRAGGRSHVRPGTVLEFLKNLSAWRLWRMRAWRRNLPPRS